MKETFDLLYFKQTPNPSANEFIPKGGSTSRLSNVSQSSMSAFSQALFSHPSMGSPATAGLAPGKLRVMIYSTVFWVFFNQT